MRVAEPTPSVPPADVYASAQSSVLGDTERAYAERDTYRKGMKIALVAVALSALGNVVLANRYQHDVIVYAATSDRIRFDARSLDAPPADKYVAKQLGDFVTALRSIPGNDSQLVDQNTRLVGLMTLDVPPYHAHQDVVAYYADEANNPKLAAKDGTLRDVTQVVETQLSDTTWLLSWKEELRKPGKPVVSSFHQGTVGVTPAKIPDNEEVGKLDPAGVFIKTLDLHV